MAATTINSYSDEITAFNSNASAALEPTEHYGRKRISYFTVTLASQASGEDIAVAILPKGARILSGQITATATLANSATLAVGLMGKDGNGFIDSAASVSDSVSLLKAAAAQGTAIVGFALTQTLYYGYKVQKDLYLTLTTGTGTVATEVIKGHVEYVVD